MPSNFPGQFDSLPLVNGGVSYPEADSINYLTTAIKAMEDSLGENPLAAPASSGYTMKGTLLEQFGEFFRIEAGEVEHEFTAPPFVDTTVNNEACGQNQFQSSLFYRASGTAVGGFSVINSTDYFYPTIDSSTGVYYGPQFSYQQQKLFTGAGKFFGAATAVVRMPGQEDWNTFLNSSGNGIMGSLPEPYDYPCPLAISIALDRDGMGLWAMAGAPAGSTGWNSELASGGNYPFSIQQGTKIKIRYFVMEATWL